MCNLGIHSTAFAHSIIRDLNIPVISPNIYYRTYFKRLLIKQLFHPAFITNILKQPQLPFSSYVFNATKCRT